MSEEEEDRFSEESLRDQIDLEKLEAYRKVAHWPERPTIANWLDLLSYMRFRSFPELSNDDHVVANRAVAGLKFIGRPTTQNWLQSLGCINPDTIRRFLKSEMETGNYTLDNLHVAIRSDTSNQKDFHEMFHDVLKHMPLILAYIAEHNKIWFEEFVENFRIPPDLVVIQNDFCMDAQPNDIDFFKEVLELEMKKENEQSPIVSTPAVIPRVVIKAKPGFWDALSNPMVLLGIGLAGGALCYFTRNSDKIEIPGDVIDSTATVVEQVPMSE